MWVNIIGHWTFCFAHFAHDILNLNFRHKNAEKTRCLLLGPIFTVKWGHKAREAACIITRSPARNASLNESFSNGCRVYKRWMPGGEWAHFFSTLALHSICAANNRVHIPHILFYLKWDWNLNADSRKKFFIALK